MDLGLLNELEQRSELQEFHLLPAARADLLRRLGRIQEAAEAYRQALFLATNDVENSLLAEKAGGNGNSIRPQQFPGYFNAV